MYLMQVEIDEAHRLVFEELVWCYRNAEEGDIRSCALKLLAYYGTPEQLKKFKEEESNEL